MDKKEINVLFNQALGAILPGEIQVYWRDVDDERCTFSVKADNAREALASIALWIDFLKKTKLERQIEC